ncbi:PTS sugar transporter subunit IIA [Vibrio coralliilyticus]|nr:PTS sugar transporter subunit IIA [Vibrio coralliilyticus]
MVVEFKSGKIIVTSHEIVVKVATEHIITLQAQVDAIQLIGRGANVIAANGSETKWSIKLDNEQQLFKIANEIGIDTQ